jgi:hypothetical protein
LHGNFRSAFSEWIERTEMGDDDRTTPLGLYNYARSYWHSGLLHDARAKVTYPDAAVTLLLASVRAPGLENAFRRHATQELKAPSRMSKPMKTAAELVALLNAELRKQDVCTGVGVEGVTRVADEKVAYTWTATALRRSGAPVPRQCSRFFVAVI